MNIIPDMMNPEHQVGAQTSSPARQSWLAYPLEPHPTVTWLPVGRLILANIGRKDSIRILNQYPFLWNVFNMSIVYWLYISFIILEINVALIDHSLSKATSKAVENNGVVVW